MSLYNDDIYLTQGEADVTHIFYVKDGEGNRPDLSAPGWSAKLFAGKKDQTNIIDGETMTVLTDQVNYRGGLSFTFTGTFCSTTPRGQYEMSVIVEHTDGRKIEYPKYPNEQFGTLFIQRTKAG